MRKVMLINLMFASIITFGQTYERGGFSNVGTGNSSVVSYTNLPDGIIGNKYLTDSWTMGYLEINDTIKSFQEKIQYDLVSGDLLIGTPKTKNGFVILDKSVTAFLMEGEKEKKYFVRKKKSDFVDISIDKVFFQDPFPVSDKQYLLIGYKKVLSEPRAARSHYTNTTLNKQYKKYITYYILNSQKKYVRVKLKKKAILSALLDKEKELKKYIKNNKLNLKEKKDLVKLLTYYHSL